MCWQQNPFAQNIWSNKSHTRNVCLEFTNGWIFHDMAQRFVINQILLDKRRARMDTRAISSKKKQYLIYTSRGVILSNHYQHKQQLGHTQDSQFHQSTWQTCLVHLKIDPETLQHSLNGVRIWCIFRNIGTLVLSSFSDVYHHYHTRYMMLYEVYLY